MKLIGMKGDSYGNTVRPEITGLGHTREKRLWNGNQFYDSKKTPFFSLRKMVFFGFA